MARLRAWVQASRPHLQIGFVVPLIYGQALAFAIHRTFSLRLLALTQVYGIFAQLFIVYSNDIADADFDHRNTTYSRFSGGSRVVPEGKLGFSDLAGAATLAFAAMACVAGYFVFREHREWMVVLAAITAHLTWMYSFPPFRLSYRGLGEVPHALGQGVLLPVVGFYAQAGSLHGLQPWVLLPSFLLGFAANVTTALPDAPADAHASKRTLAVRRGEQSARYVSLVLMAVAAVATPLAVPDSGFVTWFVVCATAGALLQRNLPSLATANAENRAECAAFTLNNVTTLLVVYVCWSVALVVQHAL